MKRPERVEVRGRGGRTIVVDEAQAAPLSAALAAVRHARDAAATEPMELVDEPQAPIWDRVDAWSERLLDWVSSRGLWVMAGVGAVLLLMVFVAGALR